MHIFDSLVSLLFKQEIKGILDNVMVPFLCSFVLQLVFVGAALIIFMNINLASNKRLESVWSALLELLNKPGNYIGMCIRVHCTLCLDPSFEQS